MAIRSRMNDTDNGNGTHTVDFWVAYDPGGGPPGTANVNVTIKWTPSQMTNPQSPSPTTPTPFVSAGGGVTVWQGATVDENGTHFTITLTCSGPGNYTVDGIGEETSPPDTSTRQISLTCT